VLALVLDALPAADARRGRQRGVLAMAGLDRTLLVAADDIVAGVQQLAFSAVGVEVEDAPVLGGELGICVARANCAVARA
jgi:hypothetical protein